MAGLDDRYKVEIDVERTGGPFEILDETVCALIFNKNSDDGAIWSETSEVLCTTGVGEDKVVYIMISTKGKSYVVLGMPRLRLCRFSLS